MADVFISYKREDKARVAPIAAGLEAEGFSVWWDPEIPLGESYAASIRRELDAATTVLPVWSTISVQSEWVQEEATLGKRKGALAPARIDPIDPPVGFTMTQTADLVGWVGDRTDAEWRRLVAHVAENAKRPAKPIPAGYRAPAAPTKRRGFMTWLGPALGLAVIALGVFLFFNRGFFSASAPPPGGPDAVDAAVSEIPLLVQAMAFRSPSGLFSIAALSPDGRIVATGDSLGAVRFFDATNAVLVRALENVHQSEITHIAWVDAARLVSAGADRSVAMVNIAGDAAAAVDQRVPERITALAVTRRSEIVIATADGALHGVSGGEAAESWRVPDGNYALSVSFSPTDAELLFGSNAGWAYLQRLNTPGAVQQLHMPGAGPVYAVFLSDGRRAAAATGDVMRVAAIESWTDAPLLQAPGGGRATAIAVSHDGRRAAQALDAALAFVWDLPTRRVIGRVETGESGTYLAFTPDGRRLLAATAEGEAGMYDLP